MAITMALTAIGTPGATSDVFQVGDTYLMVDGDGFLSMWAESNGSPGLQPAPVIVLGVVVVHADNRLQV